MSSPTLRSTNIAGAVLETRHVGAGEPVLLTHGVPGDRDSLAPVADRLAATHHAVTVSLRHAGPGPHGTRGFGTAEQRDDLADLITELELGPVHLVGWSYSAHAALALAVERPELLRSVMIYEPGFPTFITDQPVLDAIHADMGAAFGPVFAALEQGNEKEALRLSINAAAGESGWFDRQHAPVREIHQRNAAMLGLLTRQSPPVPLTAADLASIGCPMTVAWGNGSRPCYTLVAEAAAQCSAGARAVTLDHAGHLLPEADPVRFAGEIAAHLDFASKQQAAG